MNKETPVYFTAGEYRLMKVLIEGEGYTWTELLNKTGLSKGGLSKILRRLRKAGLVREVLLDRKDRKVKGYSARYKDITPSEGVLLIYDTLEELEEYCSKPMLTKPDTLEIYDIIMEYMWYISAFAIIKLLNKEGVDMNQVENIVIDSLKRLYEELRKCPRIYEELVKNLDIFIEKVI